MAELVSYQRAQPPRFIDIKKSQVGSEYDKEQLLSEFKYIYDLKSIDSDVNHITREHRNYTAYLCLIFHPILIVVYLNILRYVLDKI